MPTCLFFFSFCRSKKRYCTNRGSKSSAFEFQQTVVGGCRRCNRTRFRMHWLVVKWCNEQSYSYRRSHKLMKADRAQFVWSSSGPITLVVMTIALYTKKVYHAAERIRMSQNIIREPPTKVKRHVSYGGQVVCGSRMKWLPRTLVSFEAASSSSFWENKTKSLELNMSWTWSKINTFMRIAADWEVAADVIFIRM